MEKWLLVAETNCSVPGREEEYNNWYNTIHIPDVLETPGILNATRYECEEPPEGHGRFLTTYDVETADIEQTMAAFTEVITRKWQEGRMSELVGPVHAAFYKQMCPTIEA